MSTPTTAVAPDRPDADASSALLTSAQRIILTVVILADVLDLMDSTITNIAAPSIVRDIGGGTGLIKWLGASYALAMGVLLVVGGRLGDRYGTRRMYLIGIAGFTAASLMCGLSVNPAMLIVGRLLQGGLGALLIPQGMAILTKNLTREQLPTAFSIFGPTMGISAVAGPIVAGFIIKANLFGYDWRPIFLINIVLGTIGLAAAIHILPADEPSTESVRIDPVGSGLFGLSMLALIYGLITGSTNGWTPAPILCLLIGLIAAAAFTRRQLTTTDPLIHMSLFANKGFTSGLLMGLFFFAAMNGLAYVLSLFFQTALGFSPSGASLGLAPLMVGIIIASFLGRPLIEKLGRRLILIGLVTTFVGAAGLWATVLADGTSVSGWLLTPSILVLGLGMGASFASIMDVAIGDITPREAGSASGTLSAVQQLASALGSAIVTTIYFDQVRAHGAAHAMTLSVFVVGVIVAACLGLIRFMPERAPAEANH